MATDDKMETMKYYTIGRVEGQEELMVTGKISNGTSVLIQTFGKDQEDDAKNLIDTIAKSPKYLWDLNGETKILRSYIEKIEKEKKTGKPIPFYYAVLFDGQELPLAIAQDK